MASTILVVCGPTASGKTALGVALAQRLGGEVVSADSMQIYTGMDIGTAKPTPSEMGGIPHHMLDVVPPTEDYSVARYVEDATHRVEDILARGKLPVLVGGTGMYLDSLIAGRTFAPFTGKIREELAQRAAGEGIAPLYAQLQAIDPQRAAALHPGDEKRILRALEVFYETGQTITHHDRESRLVPPRYAARRIGLNFEQRVDLWARIDRRVDQMMSAGLAEEVARLLSSGISPQCTAMQAIGYKELSAFCRGEESLEDAVSMVKLRSRQYAKRQLTWFRRAPDLHWILWGKTPDLVSGLQNATAFLEEYGIS